MEKGVKILSGKNIGFLSLALVFLTTVIGAAFWILAQPSNAYTFSYSYVTEQSGVVIETTKNECVFINEEQVKLPNVEKAYIEYVGFKDLEAAKLQIKQGCTLKKIPKMRFTGKEFLRY